MQNTINLDPFGKPLPDTPGYIHTINDYLRECFGEKVVKLSLDGGFTCPNRDGTCGAGGCIFCSPEGSGELAGTIEEQMVLLKDKWPKVKKYLAYFQSHTSTYAPVAELKEKYDRALAHEGVVGLVIATRPDCLGEEVLDLLSYYNEKTFLWVELGLQTIHGDHINRCYDLPVYDEAVANLAKRGIKTVTHLILGLPGETKEMMRESVAYVTGTGRSVSTGTERANDADRAAATAGTGSAMSTGTERESGDDREGRSATANTGHAAATATPPIFGLKLHLLNVVKGTKLAADLPDYTPFESPEEYISLVCDLLEEIPKDITMHRLTADVPRSLLISPPWSYQKRTILNSIVHEMVQRGSYQGCRLP